MHIFFLKAVKTCTCTITYEIIQILCYWNYKWIIVMFKYTLSSEYTSTSIIKSMPRDDEREIRAKSITDTYSMRVIVPFLMINTIHVHQLSSVRSLWVHLQSKWYTRILNFTEGSVNTKLMTAKLKTTSYVL